MIASMTGYGRGQATGAGTVVVVEAKSVNSRFLDINIRLPRAYLALEDPIRTEIKKRFARGHIDVFVSISEENPEKQPISVDKGRAMAYYSALKELAQILGVPEDITAAQLLTLPDVLIMGGPACQEDTLWPVLYHALDTALGGLVAARLAEGARLQEDLKQRARTVEQYIEAIGWRAPQVPVEYAARLREKIAQLVQGTHVLDPDRLEMEVALLAERCDIHEELVRLRSHLEEWGVLLEGRGAVGRRLDFLLQEMLREINTIGAKANDLEISRMVIAVKGELEKMKEQVQNVE
ncbi:MAG: YicC family protein [Thermoanaerobacteraceae bacterium]|nr:YicC family protein [Thermoanaerobacteraceae bacterium]